MVALGNQGGVVTILREIRRAADKTQQEAADHLGVSRAYYGALETGKKPLHYISPEKLRSLRTLFGMSMLDDRLLEAALESFGATGGWAEESLVWLNMLRNEGDE